MLSTTIVTSIFQFFKTCLWAAVMFCTHCHDSALSLNCCCLGFRSLGALVKQVFETSRLSSKRSCLGHCLCLFYFSHCLCPNCCCLGFNSLGALVKQVFLLAELPARELFLSQRLSVERLAEHHRQHYSHCNFCLSLILNYQLILSKSIFYISYCPKYRQFSPWHICSCSAIVL